MRLAVGCLVLSLAGIFSERCVPSCHCNREERIVRCSENFLAHQLMECSDYRLLIIPCLQTSQPRIEANLPKMPIQIPVEKFHHQRQEIFRQVHVTHRFEQQQRQIVLSTPASSTVQLQTTETTQSSSEDFYSYEVFEGESSAQTSQDRFLDDLADKIYDNRVALIILGCVLGIILILLVMCHHSWSGEAWIILRTLARFAWLFFRGRFFRQDRRTVMRNVLARAAQLRADLYEVQLARNRPRRPSGGNGPPAVIYLNQNGAVNPNPLLDGGDLVGINNRLLPLAGAHDEQQQDPVVQNGNPIGQNGGNVVALAELDLLHFGPPLENLPADNIPAEIPRPGLPQHQIPAELPQVLIPAELNEPVENPQPEVNQPKAPKTKPKPNPNPGQMNLELNAYRSNTETVYGNHRRNSLVCTTSSGRDVHEPKRWDPALNGDRPSSQSQSKA